jgi:uncharacterized alkaline shock family protein YloU
MAEDRSFEREDLWESLARCISETALRTTGVSSLSVGLGAGLGRNISSNVMGRDPVYSGMHFSGSEEQPVVDLYLVVEYGLPIPSGAWDVQNNVRDAVQEQLGVSMKAVNIHIQGVRTPPPVGQEGK